MNKICIITTSLAKGGAEKFSALLSQMLYKHSYDVHIVSTKDEIDYEFSGKLFNLEQQLEGSVSNLKKIRILKAYFKQQNFDFIIDNRTRSEFLKEFLLYKYVFKAKNVISIVHSFSVKKYFPKSKFLAKLIYKNNAKIVAVSKEIQSIILSKYEFNNCVQIYNPVALESINKNANQKVKVKGEYILYYGRIEESVKNFTLLLNAYRKSILPKKHIKLLIIGDGASVGTLKKQINDLHLENFVNHIPYMKNPFPYVKKALFTTLTSYHEGFPMVLIESLACGTPVVSVDCHSGPNEIVLNRKNGLLVENHNVNGLANAFNEFVENEELYMYCKQNATVSINHLEVDKIALQWKEIIDENI